jgi:hypothetical protein
MPLTQALGEHFEIKLPSKELLAEIAKRSGDQELNNILSSGDKDKLASYLWGRDTLDLLLQFPEMQFSAAEFLALLKPAFLNSRSCKKARKGAIPVPGPTIIIGRSLSSGTRKTLLGLKKQRTALSSSAKSDRFYLPR